MAYNTIPALQCLIGRKSGPSSPIGEGEGISLAKEICAMGVDIRVGEGEGDGVLYICYRQ